MNRTRREVRSIKPRSETMALNERSGLTIGRAGADTCRLKWKRPNILVACNNCRAKNTAVGLPATALLLSRYSFTNISIKCDGKRPTCTRCDANNIECLYISKSKEETAGMALEHQLEQLRGELKQYAAIFDHLRFAPEAKALATMRQLRSASSISAAWLPFEGIIPSTRPSDLQHARAVLSPHGSAIESELIMLHGPVYPALTTVSTASINLENFLEASHTSTSKEAKAPPGMIADGTIDPNLLITQPSTTPRDVLAGGHYPSASLLRS